MGRLVKSLLAVSICALGLNVAHASVIDRPFLQAQSIVIVIAGTANETNEGIAPLVVDFNLLTPETSGQAAPDLIGIDGFVVNSNSGFDAGQDFTGGASRLQIDNEIGSGGNFTNNGDIDFLEASDRLSAFGIGDDTDVNIRSATNVSRFLVVSNVAFDLFAQSSNLTTSGDFTEFGYENIGFRALINRSGGTGAGRWGDKAQNPAIGGTGIDSAVNDLGDMQGTATKIFDGGRRTARFRGSLLEQAISFNIRYAFSDAPDSSDDNAYDFSQGVGTIGADVTYTIYTP